MKKNLRTLFILSASSPSIPIMWTKFSTKPSSGFLGLSCSFLPPRSRNTRAISSGILAIKFMESDFASPVGSAVPNAIIPIANQSIGWPLPGVSDSNTLNAPVGSVSPLIASSDLNFSDCSGVGSSLFSNK